MNRWRRLWLILKLMAAVAACVTAAIQAFLYMLESPDGAQIHPLSIVVVGLIFGFIIYGLLSLVERVVRVFLTPPAPAIPQPQAELETEAGLAAEQPPIPPADDSAQQKHQ